MSPVSVAEFYVYFSQFFAKRVSTMVFLTPQTCNYSWSPIQMLLSVEQYWLPPLVIPGDESNQFFFSGKSWCPPWNGMAGALVLQHNTCAWMTTGQVIKTGNKPKKMAWISHGSKRMNGLNATKKSIIFWKNWKRQGWTWETSESSDTRRYKGWQRKWLACAVCN